MVQNMIQCAISVAGWIGCAEEQGKPAESESLGSGGRFGESKRRGVRWRIRPGSPELSSRKTLSPMR